jgi:hypothetical protein
MDHPSHSKYVVVEMRATAFGYLSRAMNGHGSADLWLSLTGGLVKAMALRHRTSSQKFCSGWVAFPLLRFGHNRTCTAIGIGNANGLLHADHISKVKQVRWVATNADGANPGLTIVVRSLLSIIGSSP